MNVTFTPGFTEASCGCITRKHDGQTIHYCEKDGSTLKQAGGMGQGKTSRKRVRK